MSEPKLTSAINEAIEPSKTFLQKLLDGVERVGNKVPHPAVIFFILAGLVILLSHLLYLLGTTVTYEVVNPQTHKVETATATVNSLLSADGIRFMLTSMVRNFANFGPVAIIFVVMVGVGLAEQAGLMTALIKKIVQVTPRRAVTWILVTLGVVSSVASDAGYLVLIPLGAAAFLSLGRHPLAGLAAAFAGVAGVFGVNFLITPIDGILTEITNDAIHLLNPTHSIALTANFYFAVVSSLVLIVVCTLVTERVVEPRLGEYRGEVAAESSDEVSPEEARGLRFALYALMASIVVIALLTFPAAAPLRDPQTGSIIGNTPFMNSLIVLIMLVFLGGRDRLWRRRKDDHQYGGRHKCRHQNLCRAQRPYFSAVCHQSISCLFQLQQHRDDRRRRSGRCARTCKSRLDSIIVGVYYDYRRGRCLDCRRHPEMGDIRADFRAVVHEAGDRARSRAGGLPSGQLAAQRRISADALFCADRRVRAALSERRGCRHRRGDDAALRVAISVVWILLFLAWELLGLPFGPG